MKYPVKVIKNDVGLDYCFSVVDLPGCEVNSITMDEGLAKLNDAITSHLTILAEYGETIPQPKTIDEHMKNNSNNEVIWALLDIDIIPFMGKSHKINVTLPELLIKKIDDRVAKTSDYSSRSAFIATACLKELTEQ